MQEYKFVNKSSDIQDNLKAIVQFGKDDWIFCNELDGTLIFSKKLAKKRAIKKVNIVEKSDNYKLFIKKYRDIKKNGLYDPGLPAKFEEKVKEFTADTILDNLNIYIKHCKVSKKPEDKILMPSTYLNKNRFLDEWAIVNTDHSQKWINEELDKSGSSKEQIEVIIQEKKAWESKNPGKEITVGIFRNIIAYYLKK